MHSPTIQKLIGIFSKFPTIGPRTAARFVFYLLGLPKEEVEELILIVSKLKKDVKLCEFCYKSFEPGQFSLESKGKEEKDKFCEICRNPVRNKTLLCVIEKETDLITIEKTKKYFGRYFILGGTLSALRKEGFKKLRIKELLERAESPEIKEIILALNSTTESETTALYLERTFKPLRKKTVRLGRGLPVGAELEYADEETLSSALENRK